MLQTLFNKVKLEKAKRFSYNKQKKEESFYSRNLNSTIVYSLFTSFDSISLVLSREKILED